MRTMPRRAVLATPALLGLSAVRGMAAASSRPVLVELFTSQGCSSCPPADALLADLAGRGDVLALSLHVDYWNRLGWRDPYTLAEATPRQRAHARRLGLSYVYTPQAVIEGAAHVVGSDRALLLGAITAARATNSVPLVLRREGAEVLVQAGESPASPLVRLVAMAFADSDPVRVTRGENAGRTLRHANVVRSLQPIGTWQGASVAWRVPAAAGQRLAVIAEDTNGAIVGLAVV